MQQKKGHYLIIVMSVIIAGLLFAPALRSECTVYGAETSNSPAPSVIPSPTPSVTPSITSSASGTATPTPSVTLTPAPISGIKSIFAMYTGDSILIGEAIDRNKVSVRAFYDDGTSEEITDFIISDTLVRNEGLNTFVILYRGKTDKINVVGKKLADISVVCTRYGISAGNMIDEKDVIVTAIYSDGTSEIIDGGYSFSKTIFNDVGIQSVSVSYRGISRSVDVDVRAPGVIKLLFAEYSGEGLIAGQQINRKDLTVIAVFEDATTERLTTYMMNRDSFDKEGENVLTVYYGGQRTNVKITVTARKAVSMTAKYTGGAVPLGKELQASKLEVYVTYNDKTEEKTDDYVIQSRTINYIGDNTVRILYGGLQASVVIQGTEADVPDFGYVSSFEVTAKSKTVKVDVAIPGYLEDTCVEGHLISEKKLKKVFKKLRLKGEYIGFSFEFDDDDIELELPMTAHITLPEEYHAEATELYYTPNSKSILAKLNKTDIDDDTIEVVLHKTGTYLLVYTYDDEN